jgi:hypothetical protein
MRRCRGTIARAVEGGGEGAVRMLLAGEVRGWVTSVVVAQPRDDGIAVEVSCSHLEDSKRRGQRKR